MRKVARFAKVCIGWVCSRLRLYGLLLGDRALVVALHRVQPGASEESMTLPAPLFDAFCRFFKKHFRVVPLGEIVGKLERGESFYREMAITFDDGYADAAEVAAPILEAHGLTATFFLVSGFVGAQVTPWWDRQSGRVHAFMDWTQARAMQEKGFTMGAHTRTHQDLGKIGGETAEEELRLSRDELQAGLGRVVDLFAYPYGYPAHMSEENRSLVVQAGYRCCCGYGDFVESGSDPFRLERLPVSIWYASPAHLGGDLAVRAIRKRLGKY
ncbi:MAG: polysaccharide deacetylase family protein [Desulfovibrionaceae bacterium]|nr:polysaccharide deacetylase family protein [Desulfovibrionaceae bacterium]MBF0514279.1 polysaccharide deacetylase family protein [Desulfovibrionaceae bacterium]